MLPNRSIGTCNTAIQELELDDTLCHGPLAKLPNYVPITHFDQARGRSLRVRDALLRLAPSSTGYFHVTFPMYLPDPLFSIFTTTDWPPWKL